MKDKLETALFVTVMLLLGIYALWNEASAGIRDAIAESPGVFMWIAFTAGMLIGYLGG